MRETPTSFFSDGLRLTGTIYEPDTPSSGPRPAVIVASGYLGLNAICPRLFAGPLTEAGFTVFGFDYRGTGESEGVSGRILLHEEVRDIINAVTHLRLQEGVDPERIALLGWGMGAGIVVEAAAYDQRVAAVLALNGFYNGRRFLMYRHGPEGFERVLQTVEEDRVLRVTTGRGRFSNPYEVYPLDDATYAEVRLRLEPVPRYGPPTAVELAESLLMFEPEALVDRIAPRPLFIGHGKDNALHPAAEAEALLSRALEPKTVYWIDGKHNDFMHHEHPQFRALVSAMVEWLHERLHRPVKSRTGPAAI